MAPQIAYRALLGRLEGFPVLRGLWIKKWLLSHLEQFIGRAILPTNERDYQ